MKKMFLALSLAFSAAANATQDFHCERLEDDGTYSESTFEISLKNARHVEIVTDWDIDGLYTRHLPAGVQRAKSIWTTFRSEENASVTLLVQGQMYAGKTGFVKQILHSKKDADDVTVFRCHPGQGPFFREMSAEGL